MSSIIDALKKSDNNRTNESGANVNQIKFGDQQPPKSRRGFWLLVALLLLVVLAVFAWTQGWHHSVVAQARSWLGSDQAAQLEPVTAITDSNQTATQGTTKPATNQANKLTPPKPNEVKAKTRAAELAETEPDSERQQQLPVTAGRETDTDTKSSEQSQADTTSEQETLQVVTKNESQTDEVDAVAKKAELIAKQNRKDLEPRLKQDYLLVHQIDFEIRKNIPPIKLNIHIYDPDPDNRMVILNGVKYATGDSIEELVTVVDINQEGVVLEFEGVKFLIPK